MPVIPCSRYLFSLVNTHKLNSCNFGGGGDTGGRDAERSMLIHIRDEIDLRRKETAMKRWFRTRPDRELYK